MQAERHLGLSYTGIILGLSDEVVYVIVVVQIAGDRRRSKCPSDSLCATRNAPLAVVLVVRAASGKERSSIHWGGRASAR